MTASYQIVTLPGDGVGPEVLAEAVAVLETVASRSGFSIDFIERNIGGAAIDAHGIPVRPEDLELAAQSDAVLLGAVGGPKWEGVSPEIRPEAGLLHMRQVLGLFANLRPVKVFNSLVDASPVKPELTAGVDLIIVRELTGGVYFGKPSKQWTTSEGRRAIDTMPYREDEIERLVELGFQLAGNRRGKVTSVDKANVLSTSRLWREVATEVAEKHPDIEMEHVLVDACAMHLLTRPGSFDVMVMENMFGDILSDEASVLAGSIGMLPSASLGLRQENSTGSSARQFGLYEPIHGSAPDIAGLGKANPSGAILSAAMMLRISFGLEQEAQAIETAVDRVLAEGGRTADIASEGPTLSTAEFGTKVRDMLQQI